MSNKQRTLDIINAEPNHQKKLELLVEQDFKKEAGELIWNLVRRHTVLLFYGNPHTNLTSEQTRPGVFVVITSSSKLDYDPNHKKESEWHVVFELGWEMKALGWDSNGRDRLLSRVFGQAISRPLNQWSIKQVEGTARAARRHLFSNDPLRNEIAALHLSFHLRQADFMHVSSYLKRVEGFNFCVGSHGECLDYRREDALVEWIVDKLICLGWTEDRIRKELVEWIWLKTNTLPQWVYIVAKSKVFVTEKRALYSAVRHWILKNWDKLLDVVLQLAGEYGQEKRAKLEAFSRLFKLAHFTREDEEWMRESFVERLSVGKGYSVELFAKQFPELFFFELIELAIPAANRAASKGNYGVAVGLINHYNLPTREDWNEIVRIRELSTRFAT